MSDETLKISLLTIGDSQVGKSSLLLRFSSDAAKFNAQSMPTIGIDFKMKTVEIDGKRIKLQIWDTAGQERFRTITNSYYRKVQGILLVYDITSRSSFANVRSWMAHIQSHADSDVNTILVGNKFDLAQNRAVSYDEGAVLAKEFKIPFFETSALSNTNVDNAFMTLVADIKIRLEAEAASGPKGGKEKKNAKGKDGGVQKLKKGEKNSKAKKSSSWCVI